MRRRCAAVLFAALSLAFAGPEADAQQSDYLPLDAAPAAGTAWQSELGFMRQRMEQYEQELKQLRQQLDQQPTVPALPPVNQFTGLAGEKAAAPCDANGITIEKVEVQTKPNHEIRGRLYYDHVMFDDPASLGLDRENESGFDTARMGMYGNIAENVKYQIEVEFEGTEVDFKSVYIETTHLPLLGNVRAGHFYEPIAGLEENSGSRYQVFMERPIGITAFIPSRSFGYMLHNTVLNDDLYYAVGMFRHESDDSPTRRGTILGDSGDWVVTSRVAWNPYYDEPSDGRYLAHLGLGYSYRTDAEMVAFNTISELGNQAGFLATSVPGDQNFSLFSPEFLVIWGPVSVQSEFVYVPTGSEDFWGAYVEASYFLTGGHRGYRRSDKTITSPTIVEDFFSIRTPGGPILGIGGWEAKTRWSYVDMTQGFGPMRGRQSNWSAGLNWYLNSHTRIMFDYVYEDVSLVSGTGGVAHNFGTRFQVHW